MYSRYREQIGQPTFVNILAFESAIQMLDGLAANVRNPAPAVNITMCDVSHTKLVSLTQ